MHKSPSVLWRARSAVRVLQFLAYTEITTSHSSCSSAANLPLPQPLCSRCQSEMKQRDGCSSQHYNSYAYPGWYLIPLTEKWRRDNNLFLWHFQTHWTDSPPLLSPRSHRNGTQHVPYMVSRKLHSSKGKVIVWTFYL